jgi:pimeloyl-ACP methyl ester carboxylesterase
MWAIKADATYTVAPIDAHFESAGGRKARSRVAKGNVVLLHGWNEDGTAMLPLSEALQNLVSAKDWQFHPPITYETHLLPFTQAAAQIAALVTGLSNLVLIGYSEGGVVARQLVADGIVPKTVVTSCSPHEGLDCLIPPVDFGVASLVYNSPELNALNTNGDVGARGRYYCFGIHSDDYFGSHPDDGVVPLWSALGDGLGIQHWQPILLNYNGWIAGWDPHLKGHDPNYLGPLIAKCDQIFKG